MIASPCINVCNMDSATGLCQGCWRNIDEISLWSHASEAQRAQILADIAQRRIEHSAPIDAKKP